MLKTEEKGRKLRCRFLIASKMDTKEYHIKQSLSVEMFSEPKKTSRHKGLNILLLFLINPRKNSEFGLFFSFSYICVLTSVMVLVMKHFLLIKLHKSIISISCLFQKLKIKWKNRSEHDVATETAGGQEEFKVPSLPYFSLSINLIQTLLR